MIQPRQKQEKLGDTPVPNAFLCARDGQLMLNPVMLLDGRNYDRSNVLKELDNQACENIFLKKRIDDWLEKNRFAFVEMSENQPKKSPDQCVSINTASLLFEQGRSLQDTLIRMKENPSLVSDVDNPQSALETHVDQGNLDINVIRPLLVQGAEVTESLLLKAIEKKDNKILALLINLGFPFTIENIETLLKNEFENKELLLIALLNNHFPFDDVKNFDLLNCILATTQEKLSPQIFLELITVSQIEKQLLKKQCSHNNLSTKLLFYSSLMISVLLVVIGILQVIYSQSCDSKKPDPELCKAEEKKYHQGGLICLLLGSALIAINFLSYMIYRFSKKSLTIKIDILLENFKKTIGLLIPYADESSNLPEKLLLHSTWSPLIALEWNKIYKDRIDPAIEVSTMEFD